MSEKPRKQLKTKVQRRDVLKIVPLIASYPFLAKAQSAEQIRLKKPRRQVVKKPPVAPAATRSLAPGGLGPAPEPTGEEKQLARYLADRVRHRFASVAVKPVADSDAQDTPGRALRAHVGKLSQADQEAVRHRARAMFDAPLAERRGKFGRFAETGPRLEKQSINSKDKNLERLLNQAFEARSRAQGNFAERTYTKLPLTQLQIEESEKLGLYRGRLDIYTPQKVRFAWQTKEEDANFARWEIEPPPGFRLPEDQRKGWAGRGTSGTFVIDFTRFLPETPRAAPLTFHVRLKPMVAPESGQRSGTSSRPSTASIQAKARPAGDPTSWVPVTYKLKDWENTNFEDDLEDQGWYYRRIALHVQKIYCVSDTNEAASDQILLGGFFALCNGRVHDRGVWTVDLDFDSGETVERDNVFGSFALWDPDMSGKNLLHRGAVDSRFISWPRSYLFNLMLSERDSGGGFGEVVQDAVDVILDEIEPYVDEVVVAGSAAAGAGIGGAAGSVVPGLGTVIGLVVGAIVGAIADAIFELFRELFDNPDDLIDSLPYTLDLPSAKVTEIHRLPGTVKWHSGGRAKTEFVSAPQTLRFIGGDESGGGEYEITVYWIASERCNS